MRPLVLRLGYVALNVIDMEAVCEDAVNIAGPRVVSRTENCIMLSSNARHAELILHKSDSNGARCIGLQANNAEAVHTIKTRVKEAGLKIITEQPSLPCIEESVTFSTSEGHLFEAHTAMPTDRDRRYFGAGAHPKCIDHVNLTAEDPKKISEELNKAMGLQLVERTTGYEILWMRAADNRHHTIAATKGKAGGIHHLSWEFSSFEDFKKIGDMVDANDRTLIWGPGRHGAGDNLFTYYFDRAGFMVECMAEMEVIDDENFVPRISDPGESLSNIKVVNRWGAVPPDIWINHHNPFTKGNVS